MRPCSTCRLRTPIAIRPSCRCSPTPCTARFLRNARALPIAIDGETLVVAIADPLDRFIPAAIAAAVDMSVRLEVAVPIELDAALKRLYPDEEASADSDAAAGDASEDDTERLKDLASEAPVIRLVNQIISRAVETQASDIHIEPFEDRLRVRYRYDGVLHEADNPPARTWPPAITSRIKIMAKLDIAERRLPQDGRIRLAVRGQEIDFRVSTVPSLHGETVVLRMLDRTAVEFDYAKLGLPPTIIDQFKAALALPNGIVLVTGPTGSGKTTTLYTGLLALNSIDAQDHHGRGPDRIPAARHQPDPGAAADRADLREFLCAHRAAGSRRHHGRRDPRPRDRADRGERGADRPSRAVDAAHQFGRRRGDAAARHGTGGLYARRGAARGAGAAAGAPALPCVPPPRARVARARPPASTSTGRTTASSRRCITPVGCPECRQHRLSRPFCHRRIPHPERRDRAV